MSCVQYLHQIDEHIRLRKGNKSDTLEFHIAWPHGGAPSDLISSIKARLSQYSGNADMIIEGIPAKDHEQMRYAGKTSILHKRDAILKSKTNKQRLTSVLSTFSLGENATMETRDDGEFNHDEADITMVSYVIQAANYGKDVIHVVTDDTDIFV